MNAIPSNVRPGTGGYYRVRFEAVPASTERRYAPSWPDYVDRFYSRLQKWRSETYFLSSSEEIQSHPEYRAIIGMGRTVIPLILIELRREPSLLLSALHEITGETPFGSEDRGNLKAMTTAWLAWGERNGI